MTNFQADTTGRSVAEPRQSVAWDAIDTVLLDMDGTLLDQRFDNFFWREVVPERFARKHGMTLQEAVADLTPRFTARQGTLEWYCTDFWSRELGLNIAALKYELREQVCFLPGAEQFLVKVRGLGKRLVLLTNAHHDSLRVKCERTGLHSHFDAMLSSHAFGHPKEAQQFWHAVQASERIDFRRAVFVDDSLPVLRAARRHGIAYVYAVSKPDSTLPARVVDEFPSVEFLAQLLES